MAETNVQLELVLYDDDRKQQQRLIITDPDKYEIMSKEQKKAYIEKLKREQLRMEDQRGPFVMGKNESIKSLEGTDLTVTDRRYFMILVLYAQFNGEPLKCGNEYLNNQSIAKIWGLNHYDTSKRLNKFVRIGLLEKVKNGRHANYILNELYFQKGKGKHGIKPGEKFVKLFQNKLHEVIENVEKINALKNRHRKKPTDIGDVIGLLHAVIPYFHYETYYLVKNPDDRITREGESVLQALERNPKALKHLSKSQIGRILGYKQVNRQTIDNYMDILQKAGAVMVLVNKNKTRYLIHPDLMFRLDNDGMDEYTRHIRTMFDQHNS